MMSISAEQKHTLQAAGISPVAVAELETSLKTARFASRSTAENLAGDSQQARKIYRAGATILTALPRKADRDPAQAEGAETVKKILRAVRNAFARLHAEQIYGRITGGLNSFVRAEELVYAAAGLCPGLCPTRDEVESELRLPLAEKEGVEIAQGDFLSHILTVGNTGDHLIQAMLRPLPQSAELLDRLKGDGLLDLGTVHLQRRGAAGFVFFSNLRYLNAEDDTTMVPLETAVDLVLLEPEIEVGILRGNPVRHRKYDGRRIFSAGLNLTRLYEGKIPFMFFLTRDLGFVNKLYRGLAGDSFDPLFPEQTVEKPWIGAVEGFAIGGGCQLLPVLDYVIAEKEAYFNLPARKEGIIPGVAPMRLGRFMGATLAREGVLFDRTFAADSPEGRTMINEVVPGEEVDTAVERMVDDVADGGVVSFGANRKAIRMGQESPAMYRRYMALYAREQANCLFNPALVRNLERFWISKKSKVDRDREQQER